MSLRNGKKLADKLPLVVPPVKESMRKKHLLVSSRKPIIKQVSGTIKKKPDNAENYTFVQSLKPANDGRPEAGTERSLAFRAEVLELGGQSVYPPSAEICPTDPPMDMWSPPHHSPNWPRAPSPEYFPMEPTYSPVSPA